MTASISRPAAAPRQATRLGSVSYLNAKPLIYGLDEADDLRLTLDIPANLLEGLRDGRFDVALLPIIDYQHLPGARLLQSGGIGSDGTTYTVRIFSRVPMQEIITLACDSHSHTSVGLARVILAETYGVRPKLLDLQHLQPSPAAARADAQLLIGDKVVAAAPSGYPHQLDLGEGWKQLTGLPFLFAAWVARPGVELGDLPQRLERAKHEGVAHVDLIVQRFAAAHGWPAPLAHRYLSQYLKFDVGPAQIAAMERFFALCSAHGILGQPPRELVLA
jgi:chorismate dehydratase